MELSSTDQPFSLESAALQLLEKDRLIAQMSQAIDEKNNDIDYKTDALDKKSLVISAQKKRIDQLLELLRLQRARMYGHSSEKSSQQGELFDEAELCSEPQQDDNESRLPKKPTPPNKTKQGRKSLSPNLPREQVFINLTDEEKEGAINTFYTLAKEALDITPAKVRVIEYMQEKAVFSTEKKRTIKAATLPLHPLGKTIASVGLLAHVIVSKFCDGLPLYRLENILKRYGGDISRTSMANWVIKLSLAIQPLINLLREYQNAGDYINIDETRMQVLKEPGLSPTSQKWMWVTRGGPADKPIILFDYNATRRKEVPLRLLDDFRGYLQSDGYSGYDAICQKNALKQLGCWDHGRRHFVDAEKAAGKPKNNAAGKAPKYAVALGKIRKLYVIEDRIKNLSVDEKYFQRQKYSKPVLDDIKKWLDNNIGATAKGGKTHQAMQYLLSQWPKMVVYCEDGRLNISNAAAENAIRPFVIGRKGWLFADTPKGAKASAAHYSLIETAKANGIEPFAYYKALLTRLPYAKTVEDVETLLPWNVKISD